MTFLEFLPPMLAGVAGIVGMSILRAKAHAKSVIRIRQLNEAAALLDIHAQALHRFLNSQVAPDLLKRVLVNFSDAMSDEHVVIRLASWMSSQPMTSTAHEDSEAHKDIISELSDLKVSNSNLAEDFTLAIMTMTVGSVLRWPESAALFEQIGARLAGRPKGDLDLAVAAGNFRMGQTFGLNGHTAAMA